VVPTNRAGINDNFDELRSIGQHPFIARLLYSGALQEGEVVGRRSISMQELLAGNVGFEERFSLLGGANLKSFAGSVPNEALGAGRVELAFVERPVEPKVETPGLDACWDKTRRIIRATTGQIVWDYSRRGFFTVDTPASKAVIGYGGGRLHEFDGVSIEYDKPFANVYIAAQKPGQTLANADAIVILVLARTANKGDILEETSMRELHREDIQLTGSKEKKTATLMANPRLIIEPVTATITFDRKSPCRVYALDHDGCKPAAACEIQVESTRDGQRFTLDGHQTQTLYYLVDFGS
jgi:hypothetical protein